MGLQYFICENPARLDTEFNIRKMKDRRISGHPYSKLLSYLLSLGLVGMLGLLSGLGSSGFFSSENMPLRLKFKFDKFRFH